MAHETHSTIGILCALREELGTLGASSVARTTTLGVEVLELDLEGRRALAVVSGIGLSAAAQAATVLLASGAHRALLVVGTCGALHSALVPGDLVHCTHAVELDRPGHAEREIDSDPELRAAWRAVHPGHEGRFLSTNRPVVTPWRRFGLARRFAGPCVADMETAAAASVARKAGVPWAALRAVTDRAGFGTRASFRRHYPIQSGRAADTLLALVRRIPG